jgi:hypothetical protein
MGVKARRAGARQAGMPLPLKTNRNSRVEISEIMKNSRIDNAVCGYQFGGAQSLPGQ